MTGVLADDQEGRRLAMATVDSYWAGGHRIDVPLEGTPVCFIRFDPLNDELSLTAPLVGVEPDASQFRNIDVDVFTRDGDDLAEIRFVVDGALHAIFALICDIADRVQLAKESIAKAMVAAIDAHRAALGLKQSLSREQQIGLFGELLFIEWLTAVRGCTSAVDAWKGPLREEHDVVLPGLDIELKTTSSERRHHVIGGLGQLAPRLGASLWLVSIQITAGDSEQGVALPHLVDRVRSVVADARAQLDLKLSLVGWRDADRGMYPKVWALRNAPRCYQVDLEFPALTRDRIMSMVPRGELVSDVVYRIDVDGLEYGVPPGLPAGFLDDRGNK